MIICFNNKINNFNENNLKSFSSREEKNSYIQSLMPDITDIFENVCPGCHAKNKLSKKNKLYEIKWNYIITLIHTVFLFVIIDIIFNQC